MSKAHLHVRAPSGDWVPLIGDANGGLGPAPKTTGWKYTAASGGITDTSDVTLAAAAGVGKANYLTAIQISNASSSVATEVVVKDGSTVIWRDKFATGEKAAYAFPVPLESSNNTALYAACITGSSQVYVNAQGFTDYTSVQITASTSLGDELVSDLGNMITNDNSEQIYIM